MQNSSTLGTPIFTRLSSFSTWCTRHLSHSSTKVLKTHFLNKKCSHWLTSSSCLVLFSSWKWKTEVLHSSFTFHSPSSTEQLTVAFLRCEAIQLPNLLLKLFWDALAWTAAMQIGMYFLCTTTVGYFPRLYLHLTGRNIPIPALPGLPNTATLHSRMLQLRHSMENSRNIKYFARVPRNPYIWYLGDVQAIYIQLAAGVESAI